jgi:glycosyltransferase involved in cell wall biosynthesis
MRLAIYCDFPYRRQGAHTYADQPFVVFLAAIGDLVERVIFLGRLDPLPGTWHFQLPADARYQPLPNYERLSRPAGALASVGRSARRFWRILDEVDTVLLFGPNPLALVFAVLALIRRKHVALGIRQDYREYVRNRHPGRSLLGLAALLLDGLFRLLARRCSVIVVGPALADQYSHARRLLVTSVSLVSERDVVSESSVPAASEGEERVVLAVGRLDKEKNPLILADILHELRSSMPRWRLIVCGDGPLEEALNKRLDELGLTSQAELRGFLPFGGELRELYRSSDAFLHTSLTEGVPQVLFEAFAAGLPVVATDVGGVAETVGDAALLVPPANASAAAAALRELGADRGLRERNAKAALRIVGAQTREGLCADIVDFLRGDYPESL